MISCYLREELLFCYLVLSIATKCGVQMQMNSSLNDGWTHPDCPKWPVRMHPSDWAKGTVLVSIRILVVSPAELLVCNGTI